MQKLWLICCFLVLARFPAFSQDLNRILQVAAEQENAFQDVEALSSYQTVLELESGHETALYKACILTDRLGTRIKDKKQQEQYFRNAHKYAAALLSLYPNSVDAHFAMSVTLGRVALMSSGKELVDAIKKVKSHADRAIQLNPSDFRAYHVLGRWYYEIAALGSFKRAAVRLFYGGFPEASFQLAAGAYEKSRSLNPFFILNYYELARTYDQLDQRTRSIELLRKLQTLPPLMEDDKQIKEQAKKLLQKFNG